MNSTKDLAEYASCVSSIPMPDYVVIQGNIMEAISRVYYEKLSLKEITDLLRKYVDIDLDKLDQSYSYRKTLDGYVSFLASALIECKQYAKRYERCRELEKRGEVDEAEACYEVNDKLHKPIFILLW